MKRTGHASVGRWVLGSWLALGSAALAFLAVEMVVEALRPTPPPRASHPLVNQYVRLEHRPGLHTTTSPEALPGFTGPGTFTTNALGFRGPELVSPKPPEEYRIFMVGGSTTECFYVDDSLAITSVLQRELQAALGDAPQVRVYGVGVSGAASDDHVAMIGQRLVHLEPDMIVVFSGINDLTKSICGADPLHYPEPYPGRTYLGRLAGRSRLARSFSRLLRTAEEREIYVQTAQGTVPNIAEKVALLHSLPTSDAEPAVDPRSYGENLQAIVGMVRAVGAQVVLMTQQTTWASEVDPGASDWQWMRLRCGTLYGEEAMHRALERLNDRMRAVAREQDVPLWDLTRHLPKSMDFFYDDCHFNPAGSVRAGEGLAAFLLQRDLIPSGGSSLAER